MREGKTSIPTGAGLRRTSPVAQSKRAPWRGQVTMPSSISWSPIGASSWLQTSSRTYTTSAPVRQTRRSSGPARTDRAAPTGTSSSAMSLVQTTSGAPFQARQPPVDELLELGTQALGYLLQGRLDEAANDQAKGPIAGIPRDWR